VHDTQWIDRERQRRHQTQPRVGRRSLIDKARQLQRSIAGTRDHQARLCRGADRNGAKVDEHRRLERECSDEGVPLKGDECRGCGHLRRLQQDGDRVLIRRQWHDLQRHWHHGAVGRQRETAW